MVLDNFWYADNNGTESITANDEIPVRLSMDMLKSPFTNNESTVERFVD